MKRCPYYSRVEKPVQRRWVKGYCLAYPEMMIPSLWDERTYCQGGQSTHCPIFKTHQQRERTAFPLAQELSAQGA